VYISKISLKNIRGFKSLEFDLDRGNGEYAGWTVFTGSNGSGKSTLLKAIAFCLVPPRARFILQANNPYYFSRKCSYDTACHISLYFAPYSIDDEELGNEFVKKNFGFREGVSFPSNGKGIIESSGIFVSHEAHGKVLKGWFSCGYGPFRRISAPKENVEQIQKTKDTERFATLFFEGATLSEVDPWLTQLRFQQLEGSKSAGDQLDSFLDLVRDSLLPDGFFVDRVDSQGLWLKDSNGVELSWFDMSDGHRVAVTLVADIVRHMIATFGLEGLYGRDEAGKIFIKRSGVVLIDEIDAHLHPSWQREIGFWLKRHFPKVQFLVTSHSPIILQAADPNGLFVLPEPGSVDEPRALSEEEYRKIIASTTDTVLLSEAFGLQNTRSDETVAKRSRYSKLKAKIHAGVNLSAPEEKEKKQLELFISADPESRDAED
jgi:energy-coupling factor transporter ATP-binding protein EcfA2